MFHSVHIGHFPLSDSTASDLTAAGSQTPQSCSLTQPQWDGGQNWMSTSEKSHGLTV